MGGALTFGISRSHAGRDLEAGARLFADALAARVGRRLAVTITPDYERLLDGVLVGGIAIAWMPPLLHVRAAQSRARCWPRSASAAALCAYRAALLVARRQPAQRPRQLARRARRLGRSLLGLGLPVPAAASARRRHRSAPAISPPRRFHGSAAAACRAVVDGTADVCAHYLSDAAGAARDPQGLSTLLQWPLGHRELRQALGDPVGGQLRILEVTEPIPPDGMVLAPPLDGRMQAALRDALLSLHGDAAGAARAARRCCKPIGSCPSPATSSRSSLACAPTSPSGSVIRHERAIRDVRRAGAPRRRGRAERP